MQPQIWTPQNSGLLSALGAFVPKQEASSVPEWGIPPDPDLTYHAGPYYTNREMRRYAAKQNRRQHA